MIPDPRTRRDSIQIEVAQQPFMQIVNPAMHHYRLISSPCFLNYIGFAHRMDLGHDVQLTQTTPTRLFVGRGIQLVFVSAINRAHMSEPIFQGQSGTNLAAPRARRRSRSGRRR